MDSRVRIRTRTLLLIAVAVALLAQSLLLFFSLHRNNDDAPGGPSDLDFLLEVYGEPGGVEYQEGVRPELPLFNRGNGDWTLQDQPLSEFANIVEGLEIGPHGSSPFVVVALPDNASVGDYHRALVSLRRHGICRVGVYSPASNREFVSLRADPEPSEYVFVPVYRVLSVKLDNGAVQRCIDRFPAWTPWAIRNE